MSEREEREELFKESIREQIEDMKPRKPARRRKNHISPIALLVAGGLLVSILIRFLLGLS